MKTESSLGTRTPVSTGKSVLEQLSAPKSPARAGLDAVSSLSFRTLMANIRPGGFEDMTKRMTERRAEQQRLEKERQRERPRAEDLHGNAQVMQRPAPEAQRPRQTDEVRQAERATKASRQPERPAAPREHEPVREPERSASANTAKARPATAQADETRSAGKTSAQPASQGSAQASQNTTSAATETDAKGVAASASAAATAGMGASSDAQAAAASPAQAARAPGQHAGPAVGQAATAQATAADDSLANQLRQNAQVQLEAQPVSETEMQQLARQMGLGETSATTDEVRVAGKPVSDTDAATLLPEMASADENDPVAHASQALEVEAPTVMPAAVPAASARRAATAAANPGQASSDGRVSAASARQVSATTAQAATTVDATASSRQATTTEAGPTALPTATAAAGHAEGGSFSLGMALPTPGSHSPVRTDGSPLLSSRIDSPINSAEFKEQFARQVAGVVVQGQDRAEIRLTPAELGPIRIRVSLNADDAALDISAAHAATRAAIESSMSTLKQMLADHGLRLADYRMDQGNNAAFLSQQRQPGQESGAGMQQSGTAFGQNGGQSGGQQTSAGADTGRAGRTTDSRPTAVSGSTGGTSGVGNTPANGRLDLFA